MVLPTKPVAPVMRIFLSILPNFPWSFLFIPHFIQLIIVPQSIHWFPETTMLVRMHLMFSHYPLHRFPLKHFTVSPQIVEYLWLTYKEPCIYPCAGGSRLLHKTLNVSVIFNIQNAHASCGLIRRKRQVFTTLIVLLYCLLNIYIPNAVSVCKKKLLISNVLLNSLNTSSGHCVNTGINHCDFPIFRMIIQNLNAVIRQINSHIAVMTEVICKVFFYDILLVSAAYNKIIYSIMAINFHNMPNNWFSANFSHRLWDDICNLTQPGSKTARQNYCFHIA